jgi:predicted PurR-regulated permease PerM
MQGKYLALSPLGLFLSVTFWGWVWGVAGVLISVPLTAAVVIVCKHFESTKWVGDLLTAEARRGQSQPLTARRTIEASASGTEQ